MLTFPDSRYAPGYISYVRLAWDILSDVPSTRRHTDRHLLNVRVPFRSSFPPPFYFCASLHPLFSFHFAFFMSACWFAAMDSFATLASLILAGDLVDSEFIGHEREMTSHNTSAYSWCTIA